MRCIIYGLVLIISCYLIDSTEAQNKNYKKPKDVENGSGERYSNYKEEKIYKGYKYRNNDNIDGEEFKINRYDKQKCKGKACDRTKSRDSDVDTELTKEEKYSKYTKKFNKQTDGSEERTNYKRNKGKYEPKRGGNERDAKSTKKLKKELINDEDEEGTEEEFTRLTKLKTKQVMNEGYDKKKLPRVINRRKVDDSSEEINKPKERRKNHNQKRNVNEDEADIEEEKIKIKIKKNIRNKIKKPIDESEEESVEIAKNTKPTKKKTVRRPTVSEEDSSEETNENDDDEEIDQNDDSEQNDESDEISESNQDESDESNEIEIQRTCKNKLKGGKRGKDCGIDEYNDTSDETNNALINKKKIKYSIKFAHEKQKTDTTEDDHIMKKIHREKKKYKYQDDDDDDSSEENVHPKRFKYVDEDEEE